MREILSPVNEVKKIFGEQKIKETGYRYSRHFVKAGHEDGELWYHTMTGELLLIEPQDTEEMLREELIKKWFLVPEDFDENRQVLNLRQINSLLTPNKGYIDNFTVLTTTDCNARCFYCYEKGRKRIDMSEQTARDTAKYILSVCRDKEIKLHWFGGEPLFNKSTIDIICGELRSADKAFNSTMTTNGYLLDAETVKNAVQNWNLTSVQIALDGTKEIYNKRKAYIYRDPDAFDRVLKNIEHALNAGISVLIRINYDEKNAEDIKELAKLLGHRFGGRNNLKVYHSVLTAFGNDAEAFESIESEDKSFFEIEELLIKYGLYSGNVFHRKNQFNQCMADNDNCVVILPDGKTGKCQHFTDSEFVGDIYNGVTDTEAVKQWKETFTYPLCESCVMFPKCIHLKKCEWNKNVCEGPLYEMRMRKLKEAVLALYNKSEKGILPGEM